MNDLLQQMAATITAMRGLLDSAKDFRKDPNNSKADERLTAWIVEAEAQSNKWKTEEKSQ